MENLLAQLWLYVKGFLVALEGVPVTVGVSFLAVLIGVILGLVLALMKMAKSRLMRGISAVYIEIVRGTPMLVQALIFAYGLPQLLQANGVYFKWPYLVIPAILVCGLNSAAYVAEIIRSGLQAVDNGQMEAARTLGMSKAMAMRLIIIPQAFKIVLPSLGNEFITLIKETSILSYVGVVEITRKGTLWNAATFNTFQAYIGVALVYMVLTIPLAKLIKYLENRMSTDPAASVRRSKKRGKAA
ncbi:MAG: amino acid ABC transporter permease [Oscillospiraceae bacterium]|nr:amino acid ABC transporter permease [Oscillospiraceae bacterium]